MSTADDPRYQRFQDSSQYLNAIEIETAGNVSGLEAQVRRAMGQVNADLAIIDFRSFAEQVKNNFTQQAMIAKLTSFFGVLALVLASIGLYGVTAYSVERRTSEIGIRMALGANRMSVLRMVLRGAFLQVGIGLAIGIPVAILAGHAMASQLFGVKPYDPVFCRSRRWCCARRHFLPHCCLPASPQAWNQCGRCAWSRVWL